MTNNADRPTIGGTQWFFRTRSGTGYFATRTAERDGSFFLPYLQSGMRLLDAGCGPGTITIGLAEVVAPGEVVGVDREAIALAQAQALATERGVQNIRFEQADLYTLPFPDNSFDAAFMHGVLEHVPDPTAVLLSLRRVVRPGGVIGVRSPDITMSFVEPPDPILEAGIPLFIQLRELAGGHPRIGRTLRTLLREVGLQHVDIEMSMESFGTLEGTRSWAKVFGDYLGSQAVIEQVTRLGITDESTVVNMRTTWLNWGERNDAMYTIPWGCAVGMVPNPGE